METERVFAAVDDIMVYQRLVYYSSLLEPKSIGAIPVAPTDQVEQLETGERKLARLGGKNISNHSPGRNRSLLSSLAVPPIGGKRHKLSKQNYITVVEYSFLHCGYYFDVVAHIDGHFADDRVIIIGSFLVSISTTNRGIDND